MSKGLFVLTNSMSHQRSLMGSVSWQIMESYGHNLPFKTGDEGRRLILTFYVPFM